MPKTIPYQTLTPENIVFFRKVNIVVQEWEGGTRDAERAMEIISSLLRGVNHAEG
jgi:hypothetical protein